MISITSHRQGAILNHNHGVETAKSLTVKIEGISEGGFPVTVNGIAAEMNGRSFSCDIDLTEKFNTVTACVNSPYGSFTQSLVLVWDKASYRRCNFYIDDHSFLFTDLAKERPKSAFDHFYLKGLKAIHDKYGFKVTLNAFYHNDHHDFNLCDMPDIWKNEFIDNSDWLKFSFHSKGEFPDRIYAEATAEEFGADWEEVQNEIVRFAGAESYIAPCVIHWANVHPAVAQEAIKRGMTCYSKTFRLRVMGGPSLADRQKGGNMQQVEKRSMSGEDKAMNTEGLKLHYGFQEEDSFLSKNFGYFDPLLNLFFFQCRGVCCNLVPLENIKPRMDATFEAAAKSGVEFFNCASHEQYTFPYYPNYIPDHMARLEEAARCMVEDGNCKPCFFSEGILGNTAWDK